MKILIKDLLRRPVRIEETVAPEAIGLDDPELTFSCKSPLHVTAKVERVGDDMVLAEGTISGRFAIVCGRCLEEVENDRSMEFAFDLEIADTDEYIDLGEEIRQEVIMDFANLIHCESLFKGEEKTKVYQACINKQSKGPLKTEV